MSWKKRILAFPREGKGPERIYTPRQRAAKSGVASKAATPAGRYVMLEKEIMFYADVEPDEWEASLFLILQGPYPIVRLATTSDQKRHSNPSMPAKDG